jgi:hypothetical protein
MDMPIKIDGMKYEADGLLVVPARAHYTFKASLFRKASIVKIRSCHREHVLINPGNDFEYVYDPDLNLEMRENSYCPLEIGAFDTSAQHSWAFIDFVNAETLAAHIGCNGSKWDARGVSICQSRFGLVQRISFDVAVKAYAPDDCAQPHELPNNVFTIELSKAKCVYLFQDDKRNRHRLTTWGYDDVIMR